MAVRKCHFVTDVVDDFVAIGEMQSRIVVSRASDSKAPLWVENIWVRYGLALIATALSLFVRRLLHPYFGDRVVYTFLYPVLAFSSIYWGLGPSILCAVAGLIGADLLFLPPRSSAAVAGISEFVEAVTYAGMASVIIVAGEWNRRSQASLQAAHEALALREEALRDFNQDLEKRVTERTSLLRRAQESARQLGSRVLQLQDEERKRIARELHDSVGQNLSLLILNLSRLENHGDSPKREADLLADSKSLAEGAVHDIRTISHLLHPPLLDEMGLPSALRWYVDGFSKRSGIATELEIPAEFGRFPSDYEIAMFRIVQEALTNVHRHSGSPRALVRLVCPPGDVRLEISDQGKGIPPEQQAIFNSSGVLGVGLRGMRERVAQLGGAMELRSNGNGTTVSAVFPASPPANAKREAGPPQGKFE